MSSVEKAEWARKYKGQADGEVVVPDDFVLRGTPDKEDTFYLNRMNLTFTGFSSDDVRIMRHFALLARTDSSTHPLDPRYELIIKPYPMYESINTVKLDPLMDTLGQIGGAFALLMSVLGGLKAATDMLHFRFCQPSPEQLQELETRWHKKMDAEREMQDLDISVLAAPLDLVHHGNKGHEEGEQGKHKAALGRLNSI